MSDELTPEERAAFESLPRERMPAGLEAKVVDAMREHGFLAKRRRVIELSRGRVAGVLAASVALVIVGYSLGLHEGRGREMFVPTETRTTAEPERQYTELATPPSTKEYDQDPTANDQAPTENDKDRGADVPAVGAVAPQENKQDLKKEYAPAEPEASRADESREQASEALSSSDRLADAAPKLSRFSTMDVRANRVENQPAPAPASPREEQSPKTMALSRQPYAGSDSATRSKAALRTESFSVAEPRQTLTFNWDGQTFQLEADSVRVIEDQWGRPLHIYTAEGIIRIRLAE